MNTRRLAAAMAIPCLLVLAAPADAQTRRATRAQPPAAFDLRQVPTGTVDETLRLRPLEEPARAGGSGFLESWDVDDNAVLAIGRFRIGDLPRRRNNMERVRNDLMERENRAIAGAGVRISFD
jgi:hypothetical protein